MNKMEIMSELINIRKQIRYLIYNTNDNQLQIDLLRCMQDVRFAANNYFEGDKNMNNKRRTRLDEAKKLLNQANNIIDDIMNEEDTSFNNLTEGLQQTMRGEQMEENVSQMEEAIEKINDAIDNLDNVE